MKRTTHKGNRPFEFVASTFSLRNAERITWSTTTTNLSSHCHLPTAFCFVPARMKSLMNQNYKLKREEEKQAQTKNPLQVYNRFDASEPRHFPHLNSPLPANTSIAVSYDVAPRKRKYTGQAPSPEQKAKEKEELAALLEAKEERFQKKAQELAGELGLPYVPRDSKEKYEIFLEITNRGLRLRHTQSGGYCHSDFTKEEAYVRSKRAGLAQSPFAKALGIKPDRKGKLKVVDCTGGLGEDAFFMASLGCVVIVIERNPIVHATLRDAFYRGKKANLATMANLTLIHADARDYLASLSEDERPDVIYIDAMYPTPKKSVSLVKLGMRVLRQLVGDDKDANELTLFAKTVAKERVVIKRPKHVKQDPHASFVYRGPKIRWEVLDVRSPLAIKSQRAKSTPQLTGGMEVMKEIQELGSLPSSEHK